MEADGHSFIYFGKSQFFTFHWTEGLVGGSRGQKVVEEVQGELFFLGEKKSGILGPASIIIFCCYSLGKFGGNVTEQRENLVERIQQGFFR